MKIAFCIRPEYDNPLGGDAVQMLKTKEYLEKSYDVLIKIITDPKMITNEFAIIHVFNFSTYQISRAFIQNAIEKKIPVVSSPIYWDYSYASTSKLFNLFPHLTYLDEFTINIFRKTAQLIGNVYNKPATISSVFRKNVQWMYKNSRFVAPNSLEEANLLLKWIKSDNLDKIRIVYNATDTKKSQIIENEDVFLKKYNIPKDYILQIGRIEYCKNQLNLITALKDNPEIPIVFIGKVIDLKYYKKIRKVADKRGNVYFIDFIPHDMLNSFYRFAKLHVLLSLRESPGLVTIEALSNKCAIVISDERFVPLKTYFENQPYVTNPLRIKSIKGIVLNAYMNTQTNPFDFNKFSWETVALQTYNIYNEILLERQF